MRISVTKPRALVRGPLLRFSGAALALLFAGSAVSAAELKVEKSEESGDTVTMCVTLSSGGDSVVATQNDLVWDSSCATLVGDCTVAGGHGKDLNQAHPTRGRLKAIIISFTDTRTVIPDGDLYCCQYRLARKDCVSSIQIENASASAPGGTGPRPNVTTFGSQIALGSAGGGGPQTGGGAPQTGGGMDTGGGVQTGSGGGQEGGQNQPPPAQVASGGSTGTGSGAPAGSAAAPGGGSGSGGAAAPSGGSTGGGAPAGGASGFIGSNPPVAAAPEAPAGTTGGPGGVPQPAPRAPQAGAPEVIAQAPSTGQGAAPVEGAPPPEAATPAPTAAAPAEAAPPAAKPAAAPTKAPTKVVAAPAVAPTKAAEGGGCHCQVGPSSTDPMTGLLGLLAPVALFFLRRSSRSRKG